MRDLKFEGLSADGTALILVGKDGQKWSVTIDERIEAAVRRDRARIGQVEIEQSGELRPREIQARIRAGATAEDVAASSGLSLEHVRRFEGPVLTERAWVALQAQSTEVRRPGGDIRLGDLVGERLEAEGVDPDRIAWDAWRGDDGTWVVIATFPMGPNTHVATWTYDSVSRTMTVVDANARGLCSIDTGAPLVLTASRPSLTAVDQDDDQADAVVTPLSPRKQAAPSGEEAGAAQPPATDAATAADDTAAIRDVAAADRAPAETGAADTDGSVAADSATADAATADAGSVDAPAAQVGGVVVDETPATDDGEAQDPAEAEEDGSSSPEDEADEGLFPTPATAHRASRKRSVPSFDDILFGPGPGASKS